MTTTVKHKGSVREWEGPIKNWDKHRDVIVAWCDGAEVEVHINRKWLTPWSHGFYSDMDYRIKQREPKAGEVWVDSNGSPCIFIEDDNIGFKRINQSDKMVTYFEEDQLDEFTYSAPSVRAYFMREVMEQWEHEHKNLDSFTDWLKEQCEWEQPA